MIRQLLLELSGLSMHYFFMLLNVHANGQLLQPLSANHLENRVNMIRQLLLELPGLSMHYLFLPLFAHANGHLLGNSVNNDQTAPPGIVWSMYSLYFMPLSAHTNWPFLHPLSANLLGNSVNNDQTALPGVVWSVFALYFMPLSAHAN